MFAKEIDKLQKTGVRNPAELPGLNIRNAISALPVFFIIFLCLFFFVMMSSVQRFDTNYALSDDGSHVKGVITLAEEANDEQNCLHIEYTFKAKNNLSYTGSSSISAGSTLCGSTLKDEVTVVYMAHNPSINEVESELNDVIPPFEIFFMLPIFFLFILSPQIIPELKRTLKNRQLYKHGLWAEAEIIYAKDGKENIFPGTNHPNAIVYFKYANSDNEEIESSQELRNKWLLNQLKPGLKVNVVFDERSPNKAMLVEAYLR